jgi:hypothetical protein
MKTELVPVVIVAEALTWPLVMLPVGVLNVITEALAATENINTVRIVRNIVPPFRWAMVMARRVVV